jgi:hypothetical protein
MRRRTSRTFGTIRNARCAKSFDFETIHTLVMPCEEACAGHDHLNSASRAAGHTVRYTRLSTFAESASFFVVGPHENIYKVAERRYAAILKSLE